MAEMTQPEWRKETEEIADVLENPMWGAFRPGMSPEAIAVLHNELRRTKDKAMQAAYRAAERVRQRRRGANG